MAKKKDSCNTQYTGLLSCLKGKLPAQTTEKNIIFSSSMSNSLVQNLILYTMHYNW